MMSRLFSSYYNTILDARELQDFAVKEIVANTFVDCPIYK